MAKTYKSLRVTLSPRATDILFRQFGIHKRRLVVLLEWYAEYLKADPDIKAPQFISKMSVHCKSPSELAYISLYIRDHRNK